MFIENRINNHNQPHRGGRSACRFDKLYYVLRILRQAVKSSFGALARPKSDLPAFIIDMYQ